MIKRCPKCGKKKNWSEYDARTKWPDGAKKTVQSWCKKCNREYKKSPRGLKVSRDYYHINHVEQATAKRMKETAKRREQGVPEKGPYSHMNGKPIIGSHKEGTERNGFGARPVDSVDSTAFSEWLSHRELESVATAAEVDVERLRKFMWRNPAGFERVTLSFVDKIAVANGFRLQDIYP